MHRNSDISDDRSQSSSATHSQLARHCGTSEASSYITRKAGCMTVCGDVWEVMKRETPSKRRHDSDGRAVQFRCTCRRDTLGLELSRSQSEKAVSTLKGSLLREMSSRCLPHAERHNARSKSLALRFAELPVTSVGLVHGWLPASLF